MLIIDKYQTYQKSTYSCNFYVHVIGKCVVNHYTYAIAKPDVNLDTSTIFMFL